MKILKINKIKPIMRLKKKKKKFLVKQSKINFSKNFYIKLVKTNKNYYDSNQNKIKLFLIMLLQISTQNFKLLYIIINL